MLRSGFGEKLFLIIGISITRKWGVIKGKIVIQV